MRFLVPVVLPFIMVCSAMTTFAGKIGFLDTERAVKTVKEGQKQYALFDAWASQRADEIEAIRDRVTELSQQAEARRNVASSDVVAQLESDLLQAKRDLEDASRTLEYDVSKKRAELLGPVAARVHTVASEYAEANGFDAIFTLNSQPLVYIADSAVITAAVIQAYNERYPVD
jgi:Skp family chaperone for outer membrane proteins